MGINPATLGIWNKLYQELYQGDPHLSTNILLLDMEQPQPLDLSPAAYSLTWRYPVTSTTTASFAATTEANKKFGSKSMYFDKTDYNNPNSCAYGYTNTGNSAGLFSNLYGYIGTMECFVYLTKASTSINYLITAYSSASSMVNSTLQINSAGYLMYTENLSAGTDLITSTVKVPLNQWVHCAVTCDGTIWTLYMDGIVLGTRPLTRTTSATKTIFKIGMSAVGTTPGSAPDKIYIDAVRVNNKVDRYKGSNFIIPTAQYPAT